MSHSGADVSDSSVKGGGGFQKDEMGLMQHIKTARIC